MRILGNVGYLHWGCHVGQRHCRPGWSDHDCIHRQCPSHGLYRSVLPLNSLFPLHNSPRWYEGSGLLGGVTSVSEGLKTPKPMPGYVTAPGVLRSEELKVSMDTFRVSLFVFSLQITSIVNTTFSWRLPSQRCIRIRLHTRHVAVFTRCANTRHYTAAGDMLHPRICIFLNAWGFPIILHILLWTLP